MVENSNVSIKLIDTQLKKLKTAVKNKTGMTLSMSLKMFDTIWLINYYWQQDKKMKLRNAFNNFMSTDTKFFKAQISKTIQSGGFLGSLLSKLAGPLMKVAVWQNFFYPLQQSMQEFKKIHGSATKTLIVSNKEMNDIMRNVQAL